MHKFNIFCQFLVFYALILGSSVTAVAADFPKIYATASKDSSGSFVTQIEVVKPANKKKRKSKATIYEENRFEIENTIIENPKKILDLKCRDLNGGNASNFFKHYHKLNRIQKSYTLIDECRGNDCGLLRKGKNSTRGLFEDKIVKTTVDNLMIGEMDYVAVAAGYDLLPDLRILLKLKKAGFKINTIHIIDPIYESFAKAVESFNSIGDKNIFDPIRDNRILGPNLRFNFALFGQFLSILNSNNDHGEATTIIMYLSVSSYLKANADNRIQHVVVSEDFGSTPEEYATIAVELSHLVKLQKGNFVIGQLPSQRLTQQMEKALKMQNFDGIFEETWLRELIQSQAECGQCFKKDTDHNFMRCSGCKKMKYCSRECQLKHWKNHKPPCLKQRSAEAVNENETRKLLI